MINLTLVMNTIQKEIRNKGIIFLFIFSVISLYLGNVLAVAVKEYVDESNLNALISNSTQVIILSVVSMITMIVSIIVGTNAVKSDISLKILPQLLGFPIKRSQYLLSRIFGSWILAMTFFAVLLVIGVVILSFSNSIVFSVLDIFSTFLIYSLVYFVVIFIAIFFSLYLNKIAAFILSFVFFSFSKISYYNFSNIGFDKMEMSVMKVISMIFHYAFPRLGELNFIADALMTGKFPENFSITLALVHFVVTLGAWLFVFKYLFEKREV